MNIKLLDASVYNQISAGEVVENPASVVKELAENSIDAGATDISIFIEDGGIKSIQVIDNGAGISENDLALAIMPHATSKLFSAEDLSMISTLGFRGEALASIASVSTVEIKSIRQGANAAARILVKGGEVLEKNFVALEKGTNITVKGLFFNTPARYKFLKSRRTEEGYITRLIGELILSNPDVSVKYYIDGKLTFSSAGTGLKSAVASVYGEALLEDLLEIDSGDGAFNLKGYVGKPASKAIKNSRNFQTLIINGRLVSDARISASIQNAYGESLMKRTFPVFVLDLIMPFEDVDINVHPNKREVRFASANKVCGVFYHAVKESLRKHFDERQIPLSPRENPFISEIKPQSITQTELKQNNIPHNISVQSSHYKPVSQQEKNLLSGMLGNISKPVMRDSTGENSIFSSAPLPISDEMNTQRIETAAAKSADIALHSFDITSFGEEKREHKQPEQIDSSVKGSVPTYSAPPYKIAGQLFDTYILVQLQDELLIIDQHAAHERLIYDSFIKELDSKEVTVQDMLIPHIYEIEGSSEHILQHIDKLKELGFYIEEFGNNFLKVNAVPLQFVDIDIDKFLNDISEDKIIKTLKNNTAIKDIFAKKACKSAIKGGRTLSKEQIEYVLQYFLSGSMPLHCPHGRPVTVKISKKEIEKMFRRIV